MLTTVKPNVQSQENMCHKNENLDHLPILRITYIVGFSDSLLQFPLRITPLEVTAGYQTYLLLFNKLTLLRYCFGVTPSR